jgi:hypothetical protein
MSVSVDQPRYDKSLAGINHYIRSRAFPQLTDCFDQPVTHQYIG